MEKQQELEWNEAQKLAISVNLLPAAKQQLQFLAAVDRKRWLYEGSGLLRAIYRYNACWLPLLAKHSESQILEGPLVVPLDCEWVWHCHRLNPVRYKFDCVEFYGKILDNHNVLSSIQGTSKKETEEIWSIHYPNEPYELDLTSTLADDVPAKLFGAEKCTKYDLVSAVKRQGPFFYQVSRPHMDNDLFLERAVARYKGFLHLIKGNRERSIKRFCVPTYDIDLIWHTHQLHPVSYCKDLVGILGKVLEHDDNDSDRTKGKKLDVGFSETTKRWEETFGSRYWRAGAMHRGSAPSPLITTPWSCNNEAKKVVASNEYQKFIHLPVVKVVEVLLEFVEVRNLLEGHKGSLFVSFSKTQPDTMFNVKRRLSILSESGEKQVASFHCQPTGHFLFELVSASSSNLPMSKRATTLGSTSFPLEEFLSPDSNLSVEKWLELVPTTVNSKPIYLRVAISFTIPAQAPHMLHMVRSHRHLKSSCLFPLPGRVQLAKSWTHVTDEAGNEVISLQMRDFKKAKGRNESIFRKVVAGITKSGETFTLAEFVEEWCLTGSEWSLLFPKNNTKDGHVLELIGHRIVKLFPGRKLEYEPKHCERQRSEHDFMTAVEFSAEDPYGKAVALLDLKSGTFKVKEEWLVLPGITLAFILSNILRKEGNNGLRSQNFEKDLLTQEIAGCHEESKEIKFNTAVENEVELNEEVAKGSMVIAEKGGACSGGCGGECGNAVSSGGCGGCGGAGGCGNMVKSGSCGGCGGGCGNLVKSGGCGGCGGGNMAKSGGCGGCGGGCGNKLTCGNSNPGMVQAASQANEVLVA